ncbi:MAG: HAMP domain-containing sensor histidine kinase [Candidatus Staskawiczbacteria bacterium]|nr:HAMP domain-containing sensor histidine kinase [Candidatus Staskawiczbacteria bacterium]
MAEIISKKQAKVGEAGYINQNCWLARNLGYPPTKHCQFCQLKFNDCLFFRYSAISLALVAIIFTVAFFVNGGVSRLLIISVFTIIIIYGYYFDKSTEKIIEANFAQKKAAEELEDLYKHLQQKVDEQTKEIRRAYEVEKVAKEQLEALGNVKNQFLMTVQHHLRTPLTSMMGYTDLLLDGTFGKLPKKIGEVVKRFEASTASLIKMVNEFLDITQFQLGKEVIHLKDDINLCPIFMDIFKDIELEAKKKGIFLKLEKPDGICFVKADGEKLKAALMNIFDNAVKYTKEGGITIRLKLEDSPEGCVGNKFKKVTIEIKDTGIGIPKEKLAKLFDITFERSDAAKKNFTAGRGIGLYLSSQIIKAHNGRIWAESEGEGKGSTFSIELPVEHK